MADFSNTMAEMIARSRPQMPAGGGGGVQVIPGPYGMGGKVGPQIGVDAGALVKGAKAAYYDITGKNPPMNREEILEQAKLSHSLWNWQNSMYRDAAPEKLHMIESNPTFQNMLRQQAEAGYGGVIQTPSGGYTYLEGPPPSAQQIQGLLASRIAKTGGQDMTKEQKSLAGVPAPTQAEIMSGGAGEEARQGLVKTSREINEPTEAQKRLEQMEMENKQASIALQREQTKMLPEELKIRQAESNAQMELFKRQKAAVDLEMQKADLELTAIKEGTTKEQLTAIKDTNVSYDRFVDSLVDKYKDMGGGATMNFQMLNELAAATEAHIVGVKSFSENPAFTEKSVKFWMTSTDSEFNRPFLESSKMPFVGNSKEEVDKQVQQRMYYIDKATDLILESGVDDPSYIETLVKWSKLQEMLMQQNGYDPKMIAEVGVDNAGIQQRLQQFGYSAKE